MASGENTILLVEDDSLIAMATRMNLEGQGFRVRTVGTGEKAVSCFQKDPSIGLVLMDVDLGSGINGIRAAEIILGIRDIPIVFLTGHAEAEVAEDAGRIPTYWYVCKQGCFVGLAQKLREIVK